MIVTINLLPWRQSQRRACLRFWAVLFSGSLLLIIGCALSYYAVVIEDNRAKTVKIAAEKMRGETLVAQKPHLLLRQQQWQQRQLRKTQRDQTRSWQPMLEGLANLLPEQVWLTTLTWQHEVLELSGMAQNFSALNTLETQLRKQSLFRLGDPGETQKDALGRWQFHYRLTRSVMHERTL
ncbi:PilN domain-containing protein [Citrobacter freundii]|uniref:PilN domain-containing protein n=1 Tax=Citrobacter freundii TaxID=546 RepID=UPI0015EAD8F0|nr:PilN domain-containing protein [Citrobacter freundii]QLY59232.1 PilN domain-containing protein [Citrobacter freundii]